MRETVRDGEPALAVDTEEEFDRALGSGVYVVPPSWADAMAWHPWDEENTDFLEDVLATDDDPDPTQEDASPPRMVYSGFVGLLASPATTRRSKVAKVSPALFG